MPASARPDFFIAGAPKAGTTALHAALARHPGLFLSTVKEPKFFLTDGPPPRRGGPGDARTFRRYVWQPAAYSALFEAAARGVPRGESTPFYLYDRMAQRRIHAAIPHARFIVILRDPIDRAHSNWTHLWSAGLEPERDFVRACGREAERAAAGWALFWRYLDLGRYGRQLAHLFGLFSRGQVLVLRYRELRETPTAALDRICQFLQVATGLVTHIPAENVTAHSPDSVGNRLASSVIRLGRGMEHLLPGSWGRAMDRLLSGHLQREQRPRQPLLPEQRGALIPQIADDVALLERLTGDSFADWLDPAGPPPRVPLRPTTRIGTAHSNIDAPFTG